MKKTLVVAFASFILSTIVLEFPANAQCGVELSCRNTHSQVAKNTVRKQSPARPFAARPFRPASQGQVISLIVSKAPDYGVPTWFALRIAKVESNYRAAARGRHGELGVFQMKCATAKIIGYRGECAGLLDAETGVDVGLKHLALAIKSARGDLKLAASKHNGGLGRKSLVKRYVAAVF